MYCLNRCRHLVLRLTTQTIHEVPADVHQQTRCLKTCQIRGHSLLDCCWQSAEMSQSTCRTQRCHHFLFRHQGRPSCGTAPSRCSLISASRQWEGVEITIRRAGCLCSRVQNRPCVLNSMKNLQSASDITFKREGERSGTKTSGDGNLGSKLHII